MSLHLQEEQRRQRERALSGAWVATFMRCETLAGYLREYLAGRCEVLEVAQRYSQHQREECARLLAERQLMLDAVYQHWPVIPPDASENALALFCEEVHRVTRVVRAYAKPIAFLTPFQPFLGPAL